MNRKKLLARITQGVVKNVSFSDFTNLVEAFGFSLVRVRGSHHIYGRGDIRELVNVQDVSGQAKPYQIRQFVALIERYNLALPERER
jgi:predicted RNA binding protein YcfA (HicA-like mRNA interferase family)